MQLIDIVRSKKDRTVKFVFLSDGQVLEFSSIDKQDGKDIICVPTQTACRLGCKFCFLTGGNFVVRNVHAEELAEGVRRVISDLKLLERDAKSSVLLISYMGCGEPLCNLSNVMNACELIRDEHALSYATVRFAVASLIPKALLMRRFIAEVRKRKIPVKFHLSLHCPFDERRKELMPGANPVQESLKLVSEFIETTGNAAEMHYALIEGENDRDEDAAELIRLLKGRGVTVKFLAYNEKPTVDFHPSARVAHIRRILEEAGIPTEYYDPPGSDIGSSCGQFLMDYYLKYNQVTKE